MLPEDAFVGHEHRKLVFAASSVTVPVQGKPERLPLPSLGSFFSFEKTQILYQMPAQAGWVARLSRLRAVASICHCCHVDSVGTDALKAWHGGVVQRDRTAIAPPQPTHWL